MVHMTMAKAQSAASAHLPHGSVEAIGVEEWLYKQTRALQDGVSGSTAEMEERRRAIRGKRCESECSAE